MKKRERKAGLERMRAYVATLVPLFRLQHWQITVDDLPPDHDGESVVWTSRNAHIARLRFGDKHFADSPAEQRATLAHELIHIVTSDWETAARDCIDALDPIAKPWAAERYTLAMERDTDQLARVVAPFLPLPPETKEGADVPAGA